MARPFPELRERVAVLGAASPVGGHVKSALASRNVPGERVSLYGHARDVAVISEYDGEARLVQPVGDLDASLYGAVFVCEPGHDEGALTAAATGGTLVVDLSGTIAGAWLAGTPQTEPGRHLVAVPHPVSLMLEPLLVALHGAVGLTGASAFVLRPAADFGPPGLEELREQTVHLLRFESTPTDVFGRQLAFSVIPEHLFPPEEKDAAARVAAECRALVGAPELRLAVSMALVPTFLGHAIALHVELARGGAADALAALAGVRGVVVASDPEVGTNLDAPEEPGLVVARVDSAGTGLVRLWVLGSEPGAVAAARALGVASAAGVFVNVS
jgi:aspartate-semialdehyde dehydrogenase